MIEYRILTHDDYEDIVDISKHIWGGDDYLPVVFHDWVEDTGIFLGAIDSDRNKVIGTDKLTILPEGTGWLEGLRVHKDYKGQKIGQNLAYALLAKAKQMLEQKQIPRLAFSTHASAVESISIMKKVGFRLEQAYILVTTEDDNPPLKEVLSDFHIEPWDITYEAFCNLPYLKRRSNLLPLTFYFQEPTPALYENLRQGNCFVVINGHKGIYKFKGEPHFIAVEETFEAIHTFMNYYRLLNKDKNMPTTLTSILDSDKSLIDQLKEAGYVSWYGWENDYLYYVYP